MNEVALQAAVAIRCSDTDRDSLIDSKSESARLEQRKANK